ncbi:hypothetical protein L211DRAFT_852403 [Terfezia boudieri ATCC MYA-4762]|uniref:Uncharacterized protein n=1 Tax=Terfezia boudieri ATCC MYA-4762 TaxID=1051890 RepID=A0A3N4LMX0_9PEZI|nr:hypothetical protein L211DRAFT_853339 [Terfezia boudieri ATCC MYA-4762]RPB20380.1 hypothetical protein L211DRAFT_852403 [Terfezia boudieri ATCC MYA-4762]
MHSILPVPILPSANNIPCISTSNSSMGADPTDEIIEDSEEVTLDRLLDPYRRTIPTADDEDDSEPSRLIPTCDLRETRATFKLYVQQQWDPGMLSLSLAFEVVDEGCHSGTARSP